MSRNFIIGIIVVILLGGLAGYIAFQIHQRSMISQGETLFERGEYQKIIDLFGPAAEGVSRSEDERMLVARSLYRLGRYEEALKVLDPLLQFREEHPEALALAGWINLKQDSYLQAQGKFNTLREKGEVAVAEAGLAGVALIRSERRKKSDLNEAEIHLREAINRNKNIPQAYMLLTELKLIRHNHEEAIEAAQKAVDLAPNWSEPYTYLGRAYLNAGMSEKAEKAFKKSGASENETQYYLALSLYYQGRLTEALSLFVELSQLDNEIAKKALENAAKIRIVQGEIEHAANDLERYIDIYELNPITGIQLFEIYSRLGRMDEAEKLLNRIVSGWLFVSEAQLEKGNLLLRQGNTRKAKSAYFSALDSDPSNYLAHYNLGCIAFAQGEFYQAPGFFEASFRDVEDFYPGKVNLVMSYLQLGREPDAMVLLQKLSQEHPDNAIVLNARALERFHAGYPEVSLERIEASLEAQPGQALPFIIRGEVFLRLFQFERALSSFEEALNLNPGNFRAKLGLAHNRFRLSSIQKASSIYAELTNLHGEIESSLYTQVLNGRALVNALTGERSEAMNTWDAFTGQSEIGRQLAAVNIAFLAGSNPTESDIERLESAVKEKNPIPEAYFNLALFHELRENTEAADETYQELIGQFDSYLPALLNYGNLLYKRGLYERAITQYEEGRKGNPNRVDLLNNEAVSFEKLNNHRKCRELLVAAQKREPNSVNVRINQAMLALKTGNLEEAESHLQKMKSIGMPEGLLYVTEGLIEAKKSNWNEAEDLLDSAHQSNLSDPYAPLNHGIILAKLERYTEAEEALLEARAMNPSLAVTHRALGLLYCKLGLYDEAKESLDVSLQLDPTQNELLKIVEQIQNWQS